MGVSLLVEFVVEAVGSGLEFLKAIVVYFGAEPED